VNVILLPFSPQHTLGIKSNGTNTTPHGLDAGLVQAAGSLQKENPKATCGYP
jgi:hypothetical protein